MKLAARMMIADHPLGIGPNQYVVVANAGGYSAKAGVPWNFTSRSAPVHNTYYLVTAEMGFVGLIGLISLLAAFIAYSFRIPRDPSEHPYAELVPGLQAALITTCVHLYYEWIFMTFTLHYLFAIAAGMLVGVGTRMEKLRRRAIVQPSGVPVVATATGI